jgi:hypothetical protein
MLEYENISWSGYVLGESTVSIHHIYKFHTSPAVLGKNKESSESSKLKNYRVVNLKMSSAILIDRNSL